MSEQLI